MPIRSHLYMSNTQALVLQAFIGADSSLFKTSFYSFTLVQPAYGRVLSTPPDPSYPEGT